MSDFYNRIRSGQSINPLSDDIIMVNVDTVYDRAELASLITTISKNSPEIIGIDLLFEENKDEMADSVLIQALSTADNIVVGQRYDESLQAICKDFVSEYCPDVNRGIVNLTTKTRHGIVREFTSFLGQDVAHPSLAVAMLKKISSSKYNELLQKDRNILIRFQPEEYMVVEPDEIRQHPQIVKDKIIFVGTITDEYDLHSTPLSDDYPGVQIHANILSMVLHDDYVDKHSRIYTFILGIISALILTFMYVRLHSTQNLVIRVIPILWLAAMVYLGCLAFNKWGLYINAPQTILIASLALVVLDLWVAVESVFLKIKNRKSKATK
ncbi:MAG: CHASE2 domain-containing protein [Muribaculaceae bacterium]|nr:CHASE2 domain-containing protein [Muribaculaceae bacterium]